MKSYLAILSARFRVLLQYRAAAAAGCGTQLFWGLIRMMIFQAFYDSSTAVQPISRAEVVTYIWLGQALLGILPWNLDSDIRAMVRNGTVAYELLRPVDLYGTWYMRALAQRTAPTVLRAVPLLLVAGLFFGLHPPANARDLAAWIITTLGAVAFSSAFTTFMNVTLVVTVSGEGVARFMPPLVYTLSGMLIPLSLLPAWMIPIVNLLPFRALVDTPFRAYLGKLPDQEFAAAVAHQIIWTLVCVVAGKALLARSVRRMVIQGG